MQKQMGAVLLVLFVAALYSCEKLLPATPESNEVLAEPIGELSASQLSLHIQGDGEFARVFGTLEGLGPVFVQNSCESCHVGDGKGSPVNNLTRFGRYGDNGEWDPMLDWGGPQLQHRSILNFDPEKLPSAAASSQFVAPNVTGLGYLNAVTDETILSMADPLDLDGDGISGTINYIEAPEWLQPDPRYHTPLVDGKYIGRFGRKSGAIDLLMQTVGAYKQDMGITSDFDLVDPVNYGATGLADDGVADPEISGGTVNKVVFYLQTLKAPGRRNEADADVKQGSAIFSQVGCAKCHTPELTTGPSEIAAINEVTFYPYSDMLMHDMGAALNDGYTEGTALTSEWRTIPLWGLGLQNDSQGGKMYLMHDGRAQDYEEAIQWHGGEAAASKTAFFQLSETDQDRVIKFLDSL